MARKLIRKIDENFLFGPQKKKNQIVVVKIVGGLNF
jgi:hypothetical protein